MSKVQLIFSYEPDSDDKGVFYIYKDSELVISGSHSGQAMDTLASAILTLTDPVNSVSFGNLPKLMLTDYQPQYLLLDRN